MRKNCSSDREKLLKFEAEGREFAKILRSPEQFFSKCERPGQFLKQNAFLTCSCRSFRSNISEKKILESGNLLLTLPIFLIIFTSAMKKSYQKNPHIIN